MGDLPGRGSWTRQEVKDLPAARPDWLTAARRAFAASQDAKAAVERASRERLLDSLPKASCLCCGAEFPLTAESGGLCDVCSADDEGWLYG